MSKKKITLLSHDFSNLKEKSVLDFCSEEDYKIHFPEDNDATLDFLRKERNYKPKYHSLLWSLYLQVAEAAENEDFVGAVCNQFNIGYE